MESKYECTARNNYITDNNTMLFDSLVTRNCDQLAYNIIIVCINI